MWVVIPGAPQAREARYKGIQGKFVPVWIPSWLRRSFCNQNAGGNSHIGPDGGLLEGTGNLTATRHPGVGADNSLTSGLRTPSLGES
jgi:hypothetical protein